MTVVEAVILGAIQGVTEFLPISSSGHLVIFQTLFGHKEPLLLFDTLVHAGTLTAVVAYFWEELCGILKDTFCYLFSKAPQNHDHLPPGVLMAMWVVAGSVPTAAIGLVFRGPLEKMFASLSVVGFALSFTGLLLLLSKFIPPQFTRRSQVGWLPAFIIGTAQGLAIIPGISRSGTTIVVGLFCGLQRELAGRFSFLLSIPAIVGALMVQIVSADTGRVSFQALLAGYLTSAVIGFLSLKALMQVVRRGGLYWFSPYCIGLGLIALWASFGT